jgi:hypothetical protein
VRLKRRDGEPPVRRRLPAEVAGDLEEPAVAEVDAVEVPDGQHAAGGELAETVDPVKNLHREGPNDQTRVTNQ